MSRGRFASPDLWQDAEKLVSKRTQDDARRTCDTIGSQVERDCGMKISTNIVGWFRLLLFASGAAYLWRSGLSHGNGEPKSLLDRGLRFFGAVLFSAVVIYFVGLGLGLVRLN